MYDNEYNKVRRCVPISVILGHDVEDVTLLEVEAGLLAGYVGVLGRVVVEQSADPDLALARASAPVRRHQLERYCALRVLLRKHSNIV